MLLDWFDYFGVAPTITIKVNLKLNLNLNLNLSGAAAWQPSLSNSNIQPVAHVRGLGRLIDDHDQQWEIMKQLNYQNEKTYEDGWVVVGSCWL